MITAIIAAFRTADGCPKAHAAAMATPVPRIVLATEEPIAAARTGTTNETIGTARVLAAAAGAAPAVVVVAVAVNRAA